MTQPLDSNGVALADTDIVRWPSGACDVFGEIWNLGWILLKDGFWQIKVASYKTPDHYISFESVKHVVQRVGSSKDLVIG